MPNGFSESKSKWDELEKPLIEIDNLLLEFAKSNSLEISKNYHEWPGRSLIWGKKVIRKIDIGLIDKKKRTYSFWICAWEDRGQKRYWKHEGLKKEVSFQEIKNDLPELLKTGFKKLNSWKSDELEFATTISRI